MKLQTNKGDVFFIDDEDYDLIKDITWCKDKLGYIKGWCKKRKKRIKMHRLIMGVCDSGKPFIDHKDSIPYNNRKSNLRECTYSENNRNRKVSGFSKYLGVCLHHANTKYKVKSGEIRVSQKTSFRSSIRLDGKTKTLGLFDNETDAAKAYNEAAIKYHGEFARLNKFE